MAEPTFIKAPEVARRCGFNSERHFLKNRERLEREELFPRPLQTCLRPLKWRASEIDTWLASQGTPPGTDPVQLPGTPTQRQMLQEAATP